VSPPHPIPMHGQCISWVAFTAVESSIDVRCWPGFHDKRIWTSGWLTFHVAGWRHGS